MAKVRFELNLAGLNEIMKSDEMQAILEEAGQTVARNAGAEYGTRVHQASYVSICNVYPDSEKAAHENYKKNTLVKALSSAGLPLSK